MIKRLTIENFRVFTEETIEPSSRLNLLFGDNATGKTSILEAIGILSTLRSFRGAKLSELIKFKQEGFRITATVEGTDGRGIPLGLERRNGEVILKAEGRKVHKVSELAIKMPVQIIHPDSHLLISGGPKQRRRFLDWGVFHVEHHRFLECWKRYEKALRQRNASIRSRHDWKTVCTWDKGISDAATVIDRYRHRYIEELNTILPKFTRDISGTEKVEIEYQPGWDISRELWRLLEENRDRDKRRGFTCLGPHRAELVFKVDGMPAERHISRGQQKMLVFSLLLSQVELFKRRTGNSCILLLDDLAAELDRKHRDSLLSILREMSVQIFVTSVQRDSICVANWGQHKLFHVEHGKTTEVI